MMPALLLAGAALGLAMAVAAAPPSPPAGISGPVPVTTAELAQGRGDYIEHCGGCHGINGSSAPAKVPELRARVGYFLCTPEGRDYLIRLPNVAHSSLTDPAELATLMNYVVFAIGGGSAPAGARPYQPAEVAALRQRALTNVSLVGERRRLVALMMHQCRGVPATLKDFYAAPAVAATAQAGTKSM